MAPAIRFRLFPQERNLRESPAHFKAQTDMRERNQEDRPMQKPLTNTARLLACGAIFAVLAGCAVDTKPAPAADDSRDCLHLAQLHSTRAISDSQVIFRLYGGEEWVNVLEPSCTGLGFDRGFTYDTRLHKLCRGQLIHAIAPARSPCSLGVFRPWKGPQEAPQ